MPIPLHKHLTFVEKCGARRSMKIRETYTVTFTLSYSVSRYVLCYQ